MNPQQQKAVDDLQALSTIGEDQFESALASVVTEVTALFGGTVTCPTATSVAITFSDGSVQTVSSLPPPPGV